MKKLIFAILFGICASSVVLSAPAMAVESVCDLDPPANATLEEKNALEAKKAAAGCNESETIEGKIGGIYEVILGIAGIVAVVVIIVCGIMLTTSAGDPGKVAKAKKGILYSVVGLLVALLAWAIIKFVLSSAF